MIELRRGLIIWVAKKGRGIWKTFTVMHKMPHFVVPCYLLIYYKISFIILVATEMVNSPILRIAILHFSLLLSIPYIYHSPNYCNRISWLSFSLIEAITIILPLLSPSRASNIAVAIIGKSMTIWEAKYKNYEKIKQRG